MKKQILIFSLISLGLFSCDSDSVDFKETYVSETYVDGLRGGVLKIEKVSINHPFVRKSSSYVLSKKSGGKYFNAAIYYYANGYKACLIEDVSTSTVFSSICKYGNEISKIKAELKRGFQDVYIYNSNLSNKKWGTCMKESIPRLYNDWEEDPVGTASCWLTGPLCVVGAGIACAF